MKKGKAVNDRKMTFKGYYSSLTDLPIKLRDKIISECGTSIPTFYRWVSGDNVPSKSDREKIASILGRPVNELFPEEQ